MVAKHVHQHQYLDYKMQLNVLCLQIINSKASEKLKQMN